MSVCVDLGCVAAAFQQDWEDQLVMQTYCVEGRKLSRMTVV